jgi:glutamate-5-semialdehyde dehydrogenase
MDQKVDAAEPAGIVRTMREMGVAARAAARAMARAPSQAKDAALGAIAAQVRQRAQQILAANAVDVAGARKAGSDAAFVDRLTLDERSVEQMAAGVEQVAALEDPVGRISERVKRPTGIEVARMRVPLGVIGIIYESRPNVTADAGALCLKAGNAAILRGGSESFHSSRAILAALQEGLMAAGLPEAAIQSLPTTDRAAVGIMLTMSAQIDVIVPRGGPSLIERVQQESRIPVLAHRDGVCHVYLDAAADAAMARAVTLNAKLRRTSVCGAAETLLVDRAADPALLDGVLADLLAAGCEVRGEPEVQALDPRVRPASETDWRAEYLDAIIAVRLVDGVAGAIAHVNRYGSHHTDTIVTADVAAAERFLAEVDSAIVLHNASTQFADGGEFGMGAEIGISTGRLHARGPVGVEQLTSFKYVVRGSGQIRPA